MKKSSKHYLISITTVLIASGICYLSIPLIGYQTVALILLLLVSVLAMLLDILPVMIAAVLSAVIWNFLFIPPVFTFHIDRPEDLLMFLLYFVIALVNAVLTFKIRQVEKKARDKEEKENAIRLYDTLLNSLSHEFRTPIATIIGSVDVLKENAEKLSLSNQQELLDQIGAAGIRLNRHVENLLNMNRLETGMLRLHLDWCDMNELVYSAILKVSEDKQYDIRFSPDENLPLFRIDSGLIEQALINLIHNAVNHTSLNTKVSVSVMNNEGECMISVSDNGQGIPEQQQAHIFDKFYRLPDSKPGGSGLGLSIVKGLTEAHNGTINVRNRTEGGAIFTMKIPAETSYIHNLKNE